VLGTYHPGRFHPWKIYPCGKFTSTFPKLSSQRENMTNKNNKEIINFGIF
jgi:hypothetical protein